MRIKSGITKGALAALSFMTIVSPLCQASCTAGTGTRSDADGQMFTVVSRGVANTDFTRAAESTINGVVSIKSFVSSRGYSRGGRQQQMPFDDPFFEFFFGGSPRQYQERERSDDGGRQGGEHADQQLGLGSGVILSSDGYIVTNNHVIDGAERLEVTLNDNRSYNATVIGTDPTTDLALIKIDETDLPVIPMADSNDLKVGEWVLAVGNPFGFTSTVTAGIVSAKARSISSVTHNRSMGIESYIQTDAAVNPGNSGGALVNLNGELVGINTAIYSQTGNYAGYSFAIPTSIVSKVVKDIKDFGAVQRAILGVSIADLTQKIAKDHGITVVTSGAYISGVNSGSAAEEAGLEEGDVIIGINGIKITNVASLQEQINRYTPGEEITVEYVRDNSRKSATVKLLNSRGGTTVTKAGSFDELGCTLKAADEKILKKLRIGWGVEVSDLKKGRFMTAGIKNGMVILDINNYRTRKPEDVKKIYDAIMKDNENDHVMFITCMSQSGQKVFFAVPLED